MVVYHDGRVKQSYVPREDVRVLYAMETHGVVGKKLQPQIDPNMLATTTDWSENTKTIINQVIPVVAILGIYVAAQYAAKLKGDAEDREKIRKAEATERQRKKMVRFIGCGEERKLGCDCSWEGREISSNFVLPTLFYPFALSAHKVIPYHSLSCIYK